jgi:hypothetical protein
VRVAVRAGQELNRMIGRSGLGVSERCRLHRLPP